MPIRNKHRTFKRLAWRHDDFERRFGFVGARYTKVGVLSSCIFATVSTVLFYVIVSFTPTCSFKNMFTQRGQTPYCVVLLGFWCFWILWIKTRKIKEQRKPLERPITPTNVDFELTVSTVDDVIATIEAAAESPKDYILYRRIIQTLSNMRNIGQISDVDALFRSQAEQDENTMESSYSLVNGFLWAIPILGFIGTVMGLSSAIGHFAAVLTASSDVSELTPALKDVTAGLSTAFETTFVALVVALFLQLYSTFVKKMDEELLDDCSEFCTSNVVMKIRVENSPRLNPVGRTPYLSGASGTARKDNAP
ncbi:MAG: MotA/TolQ/ExbB proton channel family protein [Planctomycetia bacterium]|nr:MotA/TolQ/ExbB proton channel family protein [Planctomycetia bacterium]